MILGIFALYMVVGQQEMVIWGWENYAIEVDERFNELLFDGVFWLDTLTLLQIMNMFEVNVFCSITY